MGRTIIYLKLFKCGGGVQLRLFEFEVKIPIEINFLEFISFCDIEPCEIVTVIDLKLFYVGCVQIEFGECL